MARFLFRVGQWAARRSGRVITAWLVLVALAVAVFGAFSGTLAAQFSIPGTETERVNAQLDEELDVAATGASVVFATRDGSEFDQTQRDQISEALASVQALEEIPEVLDPFTAEVERADARVEIAEGLAEIEENRPLLEEAQEELAAGLEQSYALGAPAPQLEELQAELDEVMTELATMEAAEEQLELAQHLESLAEEIRTVSDDGSVAQATVFFEDDVFSVDEEVKDAVMNTLDAAPIEGVVVHYTNEIATSIEGLIGLWEVVGVIIAAIVLLIAFRAVRPAALPIFSSLIAVGVSIPGALALSDVVEMTSVTPVLGLMLGLAVGIDYTLFIVNRHRRQMRRGMDTLDSIGLATGTAGTAVVFAGLTTTIALLALNLTGIPFLGVMGNVAAVSVTVAVLVAVTFTPAVLGPMGEKVLSRAERTDRGNGGAGAEPVEAMGTLRAALLVVATIAVLLVIAVPATSMRLGLPDGSAEPEGSTQYQAYATIAEAFGEGHNGPLVVAADLPEAVEEQEELETQLALAAPLAEREDVTAVAPIGTSQNGDFMAFQVIPTAGPASATTENLVQEVREESPLASGTELGVAGFASGAIDVSDQLADALPVYLVVVLGLSVLILTVVFRSFVVPLLTAGGFALSLAAALGATTAVFQWGWAGEIFGVHSPGPLLNFLPLLLTGVLFGLAMDYQLFMVSGMREAYAQGQSPRQAVIAGYRNGRLVVTALAIIMIAVFGGFAFSQLTMVRPMGFALAIGVLFDAFVVRMALVPALMHLLGRSVWWFPRWLNKALPNVDVEGSALQHAATEATDDDGAPAKAR